MKFTYHICCICLRLEKTQKGFFHLLHYEKYCSFCKTRQDFYHIDAFVEGDLINGDSFYSRRNKEFLIKKRGLKLVKILRFRKQFEKRK